MIIPVGYVSYEYPKYKSHEVNKYVRKYSDIWWKTLFRGISYKKVNVR